MLENSPTKLTFLFIPAAKKSSILLPTASFGAPRTRFGAVKPSLSALFPSRPRDVTPVSSSLAALSSYSLPWWGVNSDIGLSFSTFLRDSGYKRFISLAPASSNFRFRN
ncbi:hypothetical protein TNCV_4002911 [Trichonephila clavipes]|nr:hypothetical protein TNCV_4002911 [Trichonephila clavipes]